MMPYLSSWVQLPKPIGDVGLYFVTLFDMFNFDNNVFFSLPNKPNVYISLWFFCKLKIKYICD